MAITQTEPGGLVTTRTFRRRCALLFVSAALLGCAAGPPADSSVRSAEVRKTLAPTGRLRIAVYPGSPTSLVQVAGREDRGLSVEIGRELARQLGVPAELVMRDRVALVVEALQEGSADMTITNANPARAALVDFTDAVVNLELGYLVIPGSPLTSLALADSPGMRIGVSQGSSSQGALGKMFKHAQLLPAASLKAAAELLKTRQIDAFATNKAILFELADGLEGARVLEGQWGMESLALAVPKGRQAAAAYLQGFVIQVRER